jgi:hypothetical protein
MAIKKETVVVNEQCKSDALFTGKKKRGIERCNTGW